MNLKCMSGTPEATTVIATNVLHIKMKPDSCYHEICAKTQEQERFLTRQSQYKGHTYKVTGYNDLTMTDIQYNEHSNLLNLAKAVGTMTVATR